MMKKLITLLFVFACFVNASTFTAKNQSFKYKIETPAPVNVVISVTNPKTSCLSQLQLLNEDMNVIFDQKNHNMQIVQKANYNIAVAKGQYTLIHKLLSTGCYDVGFDIKAQLIQGNYEVEINDNINLANELKESQFLKANLQRYDDVDYYKFNIEKDNSNTKIIFKHEERTGFNQFQLQILDQNGKEIKTFNNPTRVGQAVQKVALNKGTYFIKISKYALDDVFHLMYEIGYKLEK